MTESTKPIIRLENVSKRFNGQVVLDGVSLSVERGKTTVIIGPSGCGKSVLLKHMNGLLKPDRGKVFFDDVDITRMGEGKLAKLRQRMGFLFQGSALFDSMTVGENVMFPLEEHEFGDRPRRQERCREVLAMVGLEGIEGKMPEELSGGQKKRVALARAIVMNPEVIFYDEPTTGLDPIRSDLINELIVRLHKALGATAVVVTHDMNSVRRVADRVLMLYNGRFIADAAPDRLEEIPNEHVRRFILGKVSDEELKELEIGNAILSDRGTDKDARKENGS
jgi:phospholipid/cholesterol/gamma-HCH transport system ATP-binding protein